MENAVDDGRNRHGFPRGYHYDPTDLELLDLLDEQLAGHKLPYPLPNIFHHVRIRDFHPAELHEEYKEHKEVGYIYFFDHREYRTAGRRPARATTDGGWKASGGGKPVNRDNGHFVGNKLTMVFYEKDEDPGKPDRKTVWALHEYTLLVGPDNKVADLALYRLYKKKEVSATRQAHGHARAGQPHHHDHQHAHGAAAPGPSNWGTPAAMAPAPSLPPPTAHSTEPHDLQVPWPSTSPESTDSNDEPPPAPAAEEGYLADEFKVWCETKQEDPQAASPCCWFPTPYDDDDDDLPMLMDESKLYCTFEELLAAPMQYDAAAPSAMLMPDDANKDDMAAPAMPMADNTNKDGMAAPATSMPDDDHQV